MTSRLGVNQVESFVRLGAPLPSKLVLTTAPQLPSTFHPVTLVATVAHDPGIYVPHGTVMFVDGYTEQPVCSDVPVVGKQAVCAFVPTAPADHHRYRALFSGDFQQDPSSAYTDVTITESGAVARRSLSSTSGQWQSPVLAGDIVDGGATRQFAVSHDGAYVAQIGTNGGVHFRSTDFTLDNSIPGLRPIKIAMDVDKDKQAHLVAIDADHNVWHQMRYASGAWSGWAWLAGLKANDVSVAVDSGGNLHVVVTGTDGTVWHRIRGVSGSWTAWVYLRGYGGAALLKASKVAIAFQTPGSLADELAVIVIGTDGYLYSMVRRPDASWTDPARWSNPGGSGAASSISTAFGQQGVVAVTTAMAKCITELATRVWAGRRSSSPHLALVPPMLRSASEATSTYIPLDKRLK
jgi:hypothetical protein